MGVAPQAIDRTFAALADPHRRAVIELLRDRPRPAGELAKALDLTPPAMSRHLRALRQGGLVTETHPEFDARVRVYALRPGAMDDIRDWLARTEALWSDQLAAFKAHVEATEPGGEDAGVPASNVSRPGEGE